MIHTIELKDRKIVTILSCLDFFEQIDIYMGHEARDYLEEQKRELEDIIEEESYLVAAEYYHNVICSVIKELGVFDKLLCENQLDRKRLLREKRIIYEMLDRELKY